MKSGLEAIKQKEKEIYFYREHATTIIPTIPTLPKPAPTIEKPMFCKDNRKKIQLKVKKLLGKN